MPFPRRPRVLVPAGLAVLGVVVGVPAAVAATGPSLQVDGLADGALLGADAVDALAVQVGVEGEAPEVTATLDGRPVELAGEGARREWRPGPLPDGEHELVVAVPGGMFGSAEVERTFTVDTTPPEVDLGEPPEVGIAEPVEVQGTVRGAQEVTLSGKPLDVADDAFHLRFDAPPADAVVVARDAAGNTTEAPVTVVVRRPAMRAVHMTALAWTSDRLREPILQMLREGRIDTVELDVKDESGEVGYDSQVELAQQAGAVTGYYDAREALDTLHDLGATVVGRVVAFRDPVLAEWAWENGHRDAVTQTSGGAPYTGGYGDFAFTNFADPLVRQYNVDLAEEAAELGFDDVLYDYIRRPDGDLSGMRFPGLEGTPEESVASFLGEARAAVRPHGTYLGASVFGIAVDRPTQIAQDIRLMGEHADYLAPMVYPSHWAPGEYDVARPNSSPYDIVDRSLAHYREVLADAGLAHVQVVPWLQDFSLGVSYGPDEVAAQIRAAEDNETAGYLLWNAAARYTAAALPPAER